MWLGPVHLWRAHQTNRDGQLLQAICIRKQNGDWILRARPAVGFTEAYDMMSGAGKP
ncbi:hypothetical protein OOU_Y34scaffold00855g12 [Pyricularia oryzae Y34]|uniref:Uncharacterized protein n=1 Tax=Pyricularia oryzae (strain Y34) TaxID=1143189 RepID=A0AA97NPA2_PYRO3|nr:hypothetical protein OOU_Y34scaffold00855g12 [Pyricularia oryzae Y34]